MTWSPDETPPPGRRLGPLDWLRVLRRGLPVGLVTFGGLAVLLLLRLVERPIFGLRRPWTPWITVGVCRFALWGMGFGVELRGAPMHGPGAVVANHSSWLDIFALNSVQRVYFVAKSEVRGWAGIGWLARATGTLFIRRDRREAAAQRDLFRARLGAGHQLLFFPEGTSTDGCRVLAFKSTLFEAFAGTDLAVQPVSVTWYPPEGEPGRYYGWWGEMDFASNLVKVLATPRQGRLVLGYHQPVAAQEFASRKDLAKSLEAVVRAGQGLAAGHAG